MTVGTCPLVSSHSLLSGWLTPPYYRDHLPTRYAELENPDSYFQELGQRIQDRVTDLTPQLAGPDQPGEGHLAKPGRSNAAPEPGGGDRPERPAVLPGAGERADLDEETAAYYGDLNQTIQDVHDLTRQALDGPEATNSR